MALKAGPQPPDFIAQLMLRYWGIGKPLDNDEREILLFALDNENKALGGTIHRDATELVKKKIIKSAIDSSRIDQKGL
jgi:hypothetical protein